MVLAKALPANIRVGVLHFLPGIVCFTTQHYLRLLGLDPRDDVTPFALRVAVTLEHTALARIAWAVVCRAVDCVPVNAKSSRPAVGQTVDKVVSICG